MKLKELLAVTDEYLRIDIYKEDEPEGVIKLIEARKHGEDSIVLNSYADWEVRHIVPGIYGQHDSPYMNVILTQRKSSIKEEQKDLYTVAREEMQNNFKG